MEHTFKPHQPVVVRRDENVMWRADFFSSYEKEDLFPYFCIGGKYQQCLPAEGNEHLIGTKLSPTPPEPEFKFGDKVEVSDTGNVWGKAIFVAKDPEYPEYPYAAVLRGRMATARFMKCRHADW